MKKIIALVIFITSCTSNPIIKKDDRLLGITLKDLNGNSFQFASLKNSKANVIIFLSPECPMCKGYSTTLRSLWSEYKNKDVHFIGVLPRNDFSTDVINEFRTTYQIPFELVIDDKQELTSYLNATITPECFVLNENGNILYRGKIDDYAVAPGVTKQRVTQHYLSDALDSITENKNVAIPKTEPAGCFIQIQ